MRAAAEEYHAEFGAKEAAIAALMAEADATKGHMQAEIEKLRTDMEVSRPHLLPPPPPSSSPRGDERGQDLSLQPVVAGQVMGFSILAQAPLGPYGQSRLQSSPTLNLLST